VENGGQPAFRLALRQSGRVLGRKQPRTSRERCYVVWTLCDWVSNCDRGLISGAYLMHMPAHWIAGERDRTSRSRDSDGRESDPSERSCGATVGYQTI
jgi:hypothetical protein